MTSKILIVGGGKIGQMVTLLLAGCGDYDVTVIDNADHNFKILQDMGASTKIVDVTKEAELDNAAQGFDFMLSCAPFFLTPQIAKAAKKAKAHYFDLTEDVAVTKMVRELADGAETAFMPQSGLAPGFISIAAYDLSKKFDTIDDLRMRVGALPKYPSNAIKYNLTWSTEGLINEYIHPCQALVDGDMVDVPALEGYETFALDGILYEAFNTSGGLGTLCETLKGKTRNLNYRSVRYPGHRDVMRLMLNDLKLRDRPDMLKDILENAIPATTQDVVMIWVSASGMQNGRFMQETYVTKVYSGEVEGRECSAIQITTAASVCAVIDMMRDGKLPQKGFVKQEEVNLDDFLNNRFGLYYKPGAKTASDV